ncbi:autophagy protein 5 [Blyttiomyces sp. JEL0837]|nr:autophagy protein 5 [Blyttiomyces sp. JEL0837]
MGQLKESDYVRYGSTKRVMSLSKLDQVSLWESLSRTGDFDRFWEVNVRLVLGNVVAGAGGGLSNSSSVGSNVVDGGGGGIAAGGGNISPPVSAVSSPLLREGSSGGTSGVPRSIPMRVYVRDRPVIQDIVPPKDSGLCYYILSVIMFLCIQLTFSVYIVFTAGRDTTLLETLRNLIPDLYGGRNSPSDANTTDTAVPTSTTTDQPPSSQTPSNEESETGATTAANVDTDQVLYPDVITHGIVVPLDTPVLWLSRNMSYPDNFLHLVVRS